MVVDPGCMKCMDCVSVCPNDALYFGFGKPTILAPKSDAIRRSYSVTWPEEIAGALVFLGSFLAVRGVYAMIPFLMALGLCGGHHISHPETVEIASCQRIVLLSFHSEIVRPHPKGWLGVRMFRSRLGRIECAHRLGPLSGIFGQPRVPKSSRARRACACAGKSRSLASSADRENILAGKKHFQAASDFGLFVNSEGSAEAGVV